ncbi:hypothetical protein GCM10020331_085800 [Ectobacillus funiculus]
MKQLHVRAEKEKNRTATRNEKNTKSVGSWHLNDKVCVFGQVGWISGFSGQSCYVKKYTRRLHYGSKQIL